MTRQLISCKLFALPHEAPVSQVAARIGRSKSHIWRVLKGQRKPGRELAAVLRDMGFKVEVA